MANIDDVEIPTLLFEEQASAPTTPATGFGRLYIKSDGVYFVDDAGNETGPLSAGGGGGGASFSGALVYRTTTLAVADSTDTVVEFTAEEHDTDTYHDNSTNPSRLTVPSDGWYQFGGAIRWDANTAGNRSIWLALDGAVSAVGTGVLRGSGDYHETGEFGENPVQQTTVGPIQLTAGQYVELAVRQTSGASRDIIANSQKNAPAFWVQRVATS